jgi:hypothetical protein
VSKKLWFGIVIVAVLLATLYVWSAIDTLTTGGR